MRVSMMYMMPTIHRSRRLDDIARGIHVGERISGFRLEPACLCSLVVELIERPACLCSLVVELIERQGASSEQKRRNSTA